MKTPEKQKQAGSLLKTKAKPDINCSFCGKPQTEVDLMAQGVFDSLICNACITDAHRIMKEANMPGEKYQPLKIRKTSRIIAGNREIIFSDFGEQCKINTRRFSTEISTGTIDEVNQTTTYTKETFCLLIRLLNNTVTQFGIDTEAVVNSLADDNDILETFDDLTTDNKSKNRNNSKS